MDAVAVDAVAVDAVAVDAVAEICVPSNADNLPTSPGAPKSSSKPTGKSSARCQHPYRCIYSIKPKNGMIYFPFATNNSNSFSAKFSTPIARNLTRFSAISCANFRHFRAADRGAGEGKGHAAAEVDADVDAEAPV